MNCPLCKTNNNFVYETKRVHSEKNGDGVRRKRKCRKCGISFYTVEWVKKKGEREK